MQFPHMVSARFNPTIGESVTESLPKNIVVKGKVLSEPVSYTHLTLPTKNEV